MEQIQFIYFQDYMQYYTFHHKENSAHMEILHRGGWFKLRPQLPVCFGFTYGLNIFSRKNFSMQSIKLHQS